MNMMKRSVQFKPELFANRAEEKQLFFDRVRAKTKQVYLEFNGVAGQGKSEFLKWIHATSQQEEHCSAYIDFEAAEYHRPEIYPILETIADQLSDQLSPDVFHAFKATLAPYLQELRKAYHDSLSDAQTADRRPLTDLENALIAAFNDDLKSLLAARKLVLCLDSTEKAYRLAISSFEDQILKGYTGCQNFMLVTAGQEELAWRTTEIKDLIEQHDLPRFTVTGAQEQLASLAATKHFGVEARDREVILQKMLELTQGHPFSNYKLIDFWTDGFTSPLTKTVVEAQFARSIRELSRKVVEEKILGKFQLSAEYPLVNEILWFLAPLRHIEFDSFKYVLSTFLADWFQGKRYLFFQKLMGEFQKTYIFKRWQLGSGFDLDPVVRNILLLDMRVNFPETFRKVEETLATLYDTWVANTHDATQIRNMIERLYHYATYLREIQTKDFDGRMQQELRRYLDTYFYADAPEHTKPLYNQLSRLQNTLEEDEELLTLTQTANLLEMIAERLKHSAESEE